MSEQTGQILRFGDFELDPSARSLRRSGERIALNPRAFDVLLFLTTHAGQVVSRDDLLKNVWKDAFVDDNSVTQSISALRRALAEKRGENSLIATLPGRGYQFLAPVHSVPTANGALLLESRTIRTSIVTHTDESISAAPHPRTRMLFYGLAAAAILAAGTFFAWHEIRPGPYEHIETVIADLDNETNDPDFDHSLNKLLQIDLQQSPFFTVISEGRARRTLKMMNQPSAEAITAPIAREICQRLNAQVYLQPSIALIGGRYLVAIMASDCNDGHTVGARHKEVSSKAEVIDAFSSLIPHIRRDVGESRASLSRFDKPLYGEMNTSSLEALKAYSEGERLGDAGKFPEAISLMHHAVELDPRMAVAWADLGTFYYNIGDKAHDIDAITRAYALRDTVGERERLYLIYHYSQNASGDLHAELDALRQWSSLYPSDNLPLTSLINLETWTGQYPQAAAHADQVRALEDREHIHNGISYEIAARAYFHANLPDKLRSTYAQAVANKVDTEGLHGLMLQFFANNGDEYNFAQQIAWAQGNAAECHILQLAGFAALSAGQVQRAETYFSDATAAAQRDKLSDTLADIDEYHVRMLVDLGLTDQAKALLARLPQEDSSLDKLFTEAEILAPDKAAAEARRLAAASPTDTLLNAEYAPSVLAIVALHSGRAQDAVNLMQTSAPYELRDPTVPYLRGQAFLAAHNGPAAEAEFNKLIGRPWLGDPIAPLTTLAELQLARTYAMEGQKEKAAATYQHFLNNWHTADPNLPVLQRAHTELSALITHP